MIENEGDETKRKKIYNIIIIIDIFLLFFLLLNKPVSDTVKRLFGISTFSFLLPLGFAYYSLEAIAYVTDVYKKKINSETNLLQFSLFISFFPKIIQGPITRYSVLKEQLSIPHHFCYQQFAHGAQLSLWGLFKKMVIADRLNTVVSTIFKDPSSGSIALFGAILFYIQLYADFSGCMDLIGGISEMLGIYLPANFNRPFAACSIKDFWRRWHISLSSWLRDYVYIPLGGSRKGNVRKACNLLITFIVSGIWHGASPCYLAWGILHGIYQILANILRPVAIRWIKRRKLTCDSFGFLLLQRAFTFMLVSLAWIFFRGNGLKASLHMYGMIFSQFQLFSLIQNIYSFGISETYSWFLLIAISLMFIIENIRSKTDIRASLDRQPLVLRWAVYFSGIVVVILAGKYGIEGTGMFLYAQY